MGVCVQQMDLEAPGMTIQLNDANLAHGWVWVCVRRDPHTSPADWHIQGVAADEQIAIEMCDDENYMIGPLPLNASLPHDRIEWAGAYFPLRK